MKSVALQKIAIYVAIGFGIVVVLLGTWELIDPTLSSKIVFSEGVIVLGFMVAKNLVTR